MKTVILVPRREGFAERDAIWAWCKTWWARELPFPIIEGHHTEGLFNRSAAINLAARKAGKWDVAVIIDADVICDPKHVREAIAQAHQTGKMVVPFTVRHNLSRVGSRLVMGGEKGSWRRFIQQEWYDQHSSVIAVPRRLFEEVGGFDEEFRGWGMEDTAFAISCITFAGENIHMPGEVWHFWHAPAPEGHRHTPSANANRARGELYRAAMGDKAAIRALRSGVQPEPVDEAGIPRILHRVVPEHSPPEAEAWWQRFAELHSDWRQMTHRDPLDPIAWPETSKAWRQCKSGAQLAGLVRLEALWRWGGVYVDQDVEPFRSFEPLRGVQAFAAWEDEKVVPDAVLGAVPGHPAIRACLDRALKMVRRGAWHSGPGVTTAILPGRSDVLLLPPGSFYAVHYRDPDRKAAMRAPQPPWAFTLHHYWGSWLPKDRQHVPTEEAA